MPEEFHQRAFVLPPDATELVLVRHGASAAATREEPFPTVDGHGDPPLAARGEEQARAVAGALAGDGLAGIVVTGLRRTEQTAAPLAAATGHVPQVVTELREVGLGDWEGGEFRIRMAEGDPIGVRLLAEERWDVIPNAEPAEDFGRRVRAGAQRVVAQAGPGASVAVVVHGGVVAELCRQATDSRPFAFIGVENASITRLVVLGDGRWLLRTFNETSHLR